MKQQSLDVVRILTVSSKNYRDLIIARLGKNWFRTSPASLKILVTFVRKTLQ